MPKKKRAGINEALDAVKRQREMLGVTAKGRRKSSPCVEKQIKQGKSLEDAERACVGAGARLNLLDRLTGKKPESD